MSGSHLLSYDAPKDYPNKMIANNKLRPSNVTFIQEISIRAYHLKHVDRNKSLIVREAKIIS